MVTANSLPFRPEKWGTVPLSLKSGVPVPLVLKLRLWAYILGSTVFLPPATSRHAAAYNAHYYSK